MKTIKLVNGEVRNGYSYNELPEDIQDKILNNWINVDIETMTEESDYYYLAEKMENMGTPWFLGEEIYKHHKNDILEIIEINKYLFNDEGEMLPILYHMIDNKIDHITYGKKDIICTIQ